MNNTLKNMATFAASFAASYAVTTLIQNAKYGSAGREEISQDPLADYRIEDQSEVVRRMLDEKGLSYLIR